VRLHSIDAPEFGQPFGQGYACDLLAIRAAGGLRGLSG